jgi:hypothetical protein
VAILGSVLSAAYQARLGSALDGLPARLRDQAGESIVATLESVRRVVATADEETARGAGAVVAPAREAFVAAMHVTAVGTAATALVAVTVVLLWLPGRRRAPQGG